jgi:hypothetical protein
MMTLDYLHEMGIPVWVPRTQSTLSLPAKQLLEAIATACQASFDVMDKQVLYRGKPCFSIQELEQALKNALLKKQLWQRLTI